MVLISALAPPAPGQCQLIPVITLLSSNGSHHVTHHQPRLWLVSVTQARHVIGWQPRMLLTSHATQRGLTPNCKLRFLGVGRLGTLEMGSPLSQTGPQTLMDSCILILRGMWCEASDYLHSWILTQEGNVCEILSPLCYSLDCLLSSGCKCQSTNNILLCFDKSVCQAGGERERRDKRYSRPTGKQRASIIENV